MARTFNGSSDKLVLSGGATTSITGPYTYAAIVKRNSTGFGAMVGLDDSGGNTIIEFLIVNAASSDRLSVYTPGWPGVTSTTASLVNADGWALCAASKATGTAAPRFHLYVYATNTWTHENSGGTLPNPAASGAGGVITLGETDTDFFGGDIAVAGIWGRVLSDAEIEQLAHTLTGWHAAVPAALFHLDQSATTQNVADLTGGGANQSSVTGTSITTTSPPINYGDGPWLVLRPHGADAITGTGAITVGAPQIAGAGSFATTGAGAVTVGAPAVAGTGTYTPFTATGTGVITIPAPVLAGTGTLIYTGTGTITIPGPLLSGYSVLATRAAAGDAAYGGAVGSDAAYAGAGAGDLALVGATASDSEV